MAVVATLSKGYDLEYVWKQVDRGPAKPRSTALWRGPALMPFGVYDRESGRGHLAAHRFCGLSWSFGSPGWVCVAIWPCRLR